MRTILPMRVRACECRVAVTGRRNRVVFRRNGAWLTSGESLLPHSAMFWRNINVITRSMIAAFSSTLAHTRLGARSTERVFVHQVSNTQTLIVAFYGPDSLLHSQRPTCPRTHVLYCADKGLVSVAPKISRVPPPLELVTDAVLCHMHLLANVPWCRGQLFVGDVKAAMFLLAAHQSMKL